MSEVETLFYEATRYLNEGDLSLAKAAYLQCLAINPDIAEAHANLGYLLAHDQQLREAEIHYAAAINLSPDNPQILLNYGAMLASAKRFDEAENLYRHALDIANLSAVLWSNLGVLLACTKREAEAEQCYRKALSIDPDSRNAQFNLAYVLLRQGRFEEGWARFEARDWYEQLESLLPCPRWQGESLLGKRILMGIEAGHGDMIQFSRYCSLLKIAGALKVSILCHPGLKRLFNQLLDIDEVLAVGEAGPSDGWDYWVPALSLPYWFKTSLDKIPANIPYLHPDKEQVEHWARQFACASPRLRVGLVWKGNSRFENDADRSLPSLSVLTPLWEVPNMSFYSLQKGAGENEIGNFQLAYPLTPLGGLIEDFADTAAIVMNLDLVIAVDTAVAHLAGALGRPCWVLLPEYKTDWRWLAERIDSPWYPKGMRLFRQGKSGDWRSTITVVQQALQGLAESGRCQSGVHR